MSLRLNEIKISPDFWLYEYECPCCGLVKLDPKLVACGQRLRDLLGMPVNITSGFRCTLHNSQLGGVDNSFHVQGKAADLHSPGTELSALALKCLQIFPRVGFYWRTVPGRAAGRVLHCDVADPTTTGLPAKWGDAW